MFDINKCASAVAVAMVGTIRTSDDANRFAQRAIAEGFDSISDLIAADAKKQALALQRIMPAGPDELLPSAHAAMANGSPPVAETATITGTPTAEQVFNEAPLAAPVPPAPVPDAITMTNTTTATAGNVEVDSRGLPWDGRIHSSSKGKMAKDNTWKLRRNIDPQIVAQVEAELQAVMAIPKPAPAVTGADSQDTPIATDTAPNAPLAPAPETQGLHPDNNAFSVGTVNTLIEQGNTVAPAAAATPLSGASSKPYSEYNMADLMRGVTSKGIAPDQVATVVQAYGIPSTPVLATRPDLIPAIAEALGL